MELIVRNLVGSRLFQAGLAIRLVLLAMAAPWLWTHWFLPFVQAFIANPSLDPWSLFLQGDGDHLSYPYGPAMLVLNTVTVLLGNGLTWLTGWSHGPVFGFGLSMLAADILLLFVLCKLRGEVDARVLILYWLSPLTVYIIYFHGQTDIIPLALLLLALSLLKDGPPAVAGICVGLCVAAKLSFIVACPLPLIFLWRSKRRRPMLAPFAIAMLGVILILQAPYLLSAGVQEMTFNNPNAKALFRLAVEVAPEYRIFIAPLAYGIFLYALWRLERMSFELLIAGTGLAFLLIVLLTPATLGWYIWIVPFLVIHQLDLGRRGVLVVSAFLATIFIFHLFASTGADIPLFDWSGLPLDPTLLGSDRILPLLATAITTIGAIIGVQMYILGIRNNDFFRLSREPVTVGIAGDSGSGKDTLSAALAGIFGARSVVAVSGDDYHLWDRYAPMWNSFTHLNPRANDLATLARDVADLRRGRAVYCRRYDHGTGRFTPTSLLRANDCILVSGLHTLFFSGLVNQLDTRIYLDMDEDLRRHLKLSRDVNERGHSMEVVLEAINQRFSDSQKFIRPQMSNADIVFSLRAENRNQLEHLNSDMRPKMALHVILSYGIFYQELSRVLIGVCGLRLDTQVLAENGAVEFFIEGDVADGDIDLAARMLLPDIDDLLDISPQWSGGMIGIMQLISLVQIVETLQNRNKARGVA